MKVYLAGDRIECDEVVEKREQYPELTPQLWRDCQHILNWLSDRDKDILALTCLTGMSQSNAAKAMGIGQVLLHYHLQRIKHRLAFILYLDSVYDIFIDWLENRSHLYPKNYVESLVVFFFTTCFTHTSAVVKTHTYQTVKKRIERGIAMMAQHRHWDVYEIFTNIQQNKMSVRRGCCN